MIIAEFLQVLYPKLENIIHAHKFILDLLPRCYKNGDPTKAKYDIRQAWAQIQTEVLFRIILLHY